MIYKSVTKGYIYVNIEVYHNNKNIDFDSIKEEFEENIKELEREEKNIIRELKE